VGKKEEKPQDENIMVTIKSKMSVFCMVLIFTFIFMILADICCTDDKKSHLKCVLGA